MSHVSDTGSDKEKPDNHDEPHLHQGGAQQNIQSDETGHRQDTSTAGRTSDAFTQKRKIQEHREASTLLGTSRPTYAAVTARRTPHTNSPATDPGKKTHSLNKNVGEMRESTTPAETEVGRKTPGAPNLQEKGGRGHPILPRQKHGAI
ncbi:hypothetical protein GE061_002860 [Apolygus lucorum]|uniref:Uncharacterized protein n=1 Tax=Apolygus lucorum TaxID=248454 RepID=A0A8S9X846_APOLU|nr:hypothetical protein GE061_002860 [Apolygus lucorum]